MSKPPRVRFQDGYRPVVFTGGYEGPKATTATPPTTGTSVKPPPKTGK